MSVKVKISNNTKSAAVIRVFKQLGGEATLLPGEEQEFDALELRKGWEAVVASMGLTVTVVDSANAALAEQVKAKADADHKAKVKAEEDAKAKEEADRKAAEDKVAADKLAQEKAEQDKKDADAKAEQKPEAKQEPKSKK